MARTLDREPLLRLLEAVGPSSHEDAVGAVVAELAGAFADVSIDRLGTVRAVVNPGGRPRLALIAHSDEIGMIVKHVDELGCLWLGPIGILDPAVLLGQRVRVLATPESVPGVVGTVPPHLGAGGKTLALEDLWVDIGASNGEQAGARVSAGDPVVLEAPPVWMMGDRLTSRALDNRLGVFAALEIGRTLASATAPRAEVAVIASSREETSYGGAGAAAAEYEPDLALIVDATFASDIPVDGFERRVGHRPLGSGPTISRGGPHSDRLARELIDLAREAGIAYTIEAEGTRSGTDADAVHQLRPGIPCAGIGIPVRHLHSPGELACWRDVERVIELGVRFCRRSVMLCTVALAVAGCLAAGCAGSDESPAAHSAPVSAECGSGDPFAAGRLRADVRFLASPELGGRLPGTAGDRATRRHIVKRFRCLRLERGGKRGAYQQRFVDSDGARTANVIGFIRGVDPQLADEIIVVGAHHDHLGRRRGRLFAGANDNASGVAALLAIAEDMARGAAPPRRTVAFAAFGAEETLTVPPYVEGSDFFVRHPPPGLPIEKVVYNVNIDMLGTYSARRLAHAYGARRGTPARAALERLRSDFPGLELRLGRWPGKGDSDFWPFFRAGIPYVYMHTDDPRCLHEPCDRAGRLDYGPMSKLAELTARLTAALADDPQGASII